MNTGFYFPHENSLSVVFCFPQWDLFVELYLAASLLSRLQLLFRFQGDLQSLPGVQGKFFSPT
jgi:hypothetical protein